MNKEQTPVEAGTIEFDRMVQALQGEFFDVYEKAQASKAVGDDKRYKSWVDSLWKVARVLVDLKNLEHNLGLSSEDSPDNEFSKLMDRILSEGKLSEESKQALMSYKHARDAKKEHASG